MKSIRNCPILLKYFPFFLWIIIFEISSCIKIYAEESNKRLKSDYYLQQARNNKLPVEFRLSYYDSAMIYNKDYNLIPEKGDLYESICRFNDALNLYNSEDLNLEKLSRASLSTYLQIKMYAAVDYYIIDKLGECVKTCYEILRIPKPDSLLNHDVEAYRRLSYVFTGIGNFTDATIAINKGDSIMKIFRKSTASEWDKDHTEGKLYMARSALAEKQRNFPQAFDEEKKSRKFFGNRVPERVTNVTLGYIYYEIGEYDIAEKIFREVLNDSLPHIQYEHGLLNYIMILNKQGKTKEANSLFLNSQKRLEKLKNTIFEFDYHDVDYSLAIAMNDSARALKAVKNSRNLMKANYENYKDLYVNLLNETLESQQAQDNDNKSDKDGKTGRALSYIFGGLAFVLAGILISVILQQWKLKRKYMENYIELEDYRKTVNENERKNEESLEMRNRELVSMSMHMFQLNESITEIDRLITDKTIPPEKLRPKIKSILKDLSSKEHVWEMFKIYFEDVNQRFFDILYRKNPDLTKSELRMCAFIRAGMSSKEIAIATNRSVRTIDSIKYNLRKKLGIEESTDAYIRRISATTD